VTVEVRDVIAKLMLSSEFEPEQLTISKKLPQQCFSGCLFLSYFADNLRQTSELITATVLSSNEYNGRYFRLTLFKNDEEGV
jgi:hypothetical protein